MLDDQNVSYFLYNETCFWNSQLLPICLWSFILGTINISTNGLFLILLFISRKQVNSKRYAHVTNLTVSDFLSNLILIGHTIFGRSLLSKRNLKRALVYAMTVNIYSYFMSIFIQYYAIKRPLQYKTKLTLSKIKLSICFIWIFVSLYFVLKVQVLLRFETYSIFISYTDLVINLTIGLLNTIFYSYLVYISHRKKCEKTGSIEKRSHMENILIRKNFSTSLEAKPIIDQSRFIIKEYQFVITIGISLIVYWITTLPIYIYWLITEINDIRFYFLDNNTKLIVLLIWYTRCFFDPLLHMYREPKFIRTFKNIFNKK